MHIIDVDELRRAGFIGKPSKTWTWWKPRDKIHSEGVRLVDWSDNSITLQNDQVLQIVWQPWHYGGRRASILCSCGRRVRKMYAAHVSGQWRCRHCWNLSYASQQAVPWDRLLTKTQKIRRRLGGALSIDDALSTQTVGACIGRAMKKCGERTIRPPRFA
jgi:hypothetical protein